MKKSGCKCLSPGDLSWNFPSTSAVDHLPLSGCQQGTSLLAYHPCLCASKHRLFKCGRFIVEMTLNSHRTLPTGTCYWWYGDFNASLQDMEKLGQSHTCWCPGSVCGWNITHQDIDSVWLMAFVFLEGCISTTHIRPRSLPCLLLSWPNQVNNSHNIDIIW